MLQTSLTACQLEKRGAAGNGVEFVRCQEPDSGFQLSIKGDTNVELSPFTRDIRVPEHCDWRLLSKADGQTLLVIAQNYSTKQTLQLLVKDGLHYLSPKSSFLVPLLSNEELTIRWLMPSANETNITAANSARLSVKVRTERPCSSEESLLYHGTCYLVIRPPPLNYTCFSAPPHFRNHSSLNDFAIAVNSTVQQHLSTGVLIPGLRYRGGALEFRTCPAQASKCHWSRVIGDGSANTLLPITAQPDSDDVVLKLKPQAADGNLRHPELELQSFVGSPEAARQLPVLIEFKQSSLENKTCTDEKENPGLKIPIAIAGIVVLVLVGAAFKFIVWPRLSSSRADRTGGASSACEDSVRLNNGIGNGNGHAG